MYILSFPAGFELLPTCPRVIASAQCGPGPGDHAGAGLGHRQGPKSPIGFHVVRVAKWHIALHGPLLRKKVAAPSDAAMDVVDLSAGNQPRANWRRCSVQSEGIRPASLSLF